MLRYAPGAQSMGIGRLLPAGVKMDTFPWDVHTNGLSILVAEDDAGIREVLSALLETEGYGVVLARDGAEALSLADSHHPDLILIDLHMPRLNGESFCHLYRETGSTTPIILLTAADPKTVVAAVEACGAVAYIPKPFDLDELLDTISRHLPVRAPTVTLLHADDEVPA